MAKANRSTCSPSFPSIYRGSLRVCCSRRRPQTWACPSCSTVTRKGSPTPVTSGQDKVMLGIRVINAPAINGMNAVFLSVPQLRSRIEHKHPNFRMCLPRSSSKDRQVHVGFRGWNSSSTDCFGSLIRERSLRSFFCASSFCRKRKRGDRVACPDRPCLVMPKPFWPPCVI
jgi:hypothetical protein